MKPIKPTLGELENKLIGLCEQYEVICNTYWNYKAIEREQLSWKLDCLHDEINKTLSNIDKQVVLLKSTFDEIQESW